MLERELVLSFDDGPGEATLELSEYLAQEQIRAVFFVVGRHVRRAPSVLKQLLERGHVVGNHTENHLRLTDSAVTDDQAITEFLETDALLRSVGVPEPAYFRPPYGAWNGHLGHVFREHPGVRARGPVAWHIDGLDYQFWREGKSAERCADAYFTAAEKRKKGIILLHDSSADQPSQGSRNRVCEMMRLLVPRLKKAGYRFRSLEDVSDNVGSL